MAQIIWSEPALKDLGRIAEYIALSKPEAVCAMVGRVMDKISRLELFPNSNRIPHETPELGYREVVVAPCRVFYRQESDIEFIVHACRGIMNCPNLWRPN